MATRAPRDVDEGAEATRPLTGGETSIELLKRARAGETTARDRLFERYLPVFRDWASRRLPGWARDGVDTEDLVQETMLNTIQHLDTFRPNGDGALQAYLHQALRNRIRDELRRAHRRRPPLSLDSNEPDEGPSPLEEAIGHEALERYEAALDRLDDQDREAIVARVELGQSWAEVADVIGRPSADAARMAVKRALERLATEMSAGQPEE